MAEYGGDRPEHYESDGTKSTDDFYTYGVTENAFLSERERARDARVYNASHDAPSEREQSLQDVLERARDVEYARREVAAELECDVSEVF